MTGDPTYSCRPCGASWTAVSKTWVCKDMRGRMRLLDVELDAEEQPVPLVACPYCHTRQPSGRRARVEEVKDP